MDSSTRVPGVRALEAMLDSATLAQELEGVVFRTHGYDMYAYTERVRELVHCRDAVAPVCRSGDCELAGTQDTASLRSGTDTAWRAGIAQRHAERDADIACFENIDLLEDDAACVGPALNVCRDCKSSDVSWYQRQTRSADEGMQTYFECKNCGKRWKQ